MARNIEIKAAVRDFAPLIDTLRRLGAAPPRELEQEDTFFPCPTGRLKLRRLSDASGELIHYARADDPGPRESRHLRAATPEPDRLRDVLAAAHGVSGVVRKHRTVYMLGRTRVHLDDVEGLGRFLELEVVLGDAEPADAGVREARALLAALDIGEEQLVGSAYVDLLGAAGVTRSA
jgi:predicted adenylyl cyclase CyaB